MLEALRQIAASTELRKIDLFTLPVPDATQSVASCRPNHSDALGLEPGSLLDLKVGDGQATLQFTVRPQDLIAEEFHQQDPPLRRPCPRWLLRLNSALDKLLEGLRDGRPRLSISTP